MKKIIYLFFGLIISWDVSAQLTEFEVRKIVRSSNEEELVRFSSEMLQENFLYFASIATDKLLTFNPESPNYNYRKGFIILNSKLDYVSAIPFFEKASTNVDPMYDAYSQTELSAPTDVYYHLARCYHLNEELDKAKSMLQQFISASDKKSELLPDAELRLKQIEIAKQLMSNPKKARVVNIGDSVNTAFPEYSPVVSLDGTALYFTSRRPWEDNSTDDYRDSKLYQYPEDIYVSYHNLDENYTQPERLEFCDGQLNEATVSISSDERRIYTYGDQTGAGDLLFSDFKNSRFQKLEPVKINGVNSKYWETHCSVTRDGQQMYFVSDRPGGFGGRDIYRIVLLPNGNWSDPINLGSAINTSFDEDCPFISVDNKTLYFASNGPLSMGEFDIFVSIRDEQDVWSNPVNLGYPINSMGDDVFYTTTANGLIGYLTSFRKGGHGEKDIYRIENDYLGIQNVAILKGHVRTLDASPIPETLHATLSCTSCSDNEAYYVNPRPRDGSFMYGLVPCKDYKLVFKYNESSPISYDYQFNTSCTKAYDEIYKEVVIDKQKKRVIPNFTYDYLVNIQNRNNSKPISNATIEIIDTKTNEVIEKSTTDAFGNLNSSVFKNHIFYDTVDFIVKTTAIGYITQTFEVSQHLLYDTIIKQRFVLEPKEIGVDLAKTINLKPIYFDYDKADIRADAKKELDKIVKVMNDNPELVIELGSHTDCRGVEIYNLDLSDRRAKASAKYIQERINDPARIYGKGYGETQLVTNCPCEGKKKSKCSEKQHQENRRTEFRIVNIQQ